MHPLKVSFILFPIKGGFTWYAWKRKKCDFLAICHRTFTKVKRRVSQLPNIAAGSFLRMIKPLGVHLRGSVFLYRDQLDALY